MSITTTVHVSKADPTPDKVPMKAGRIYISTVSSGPPEVIVLCTKDQTERDIERRDFQGVLIAKDGENFDLGYTSDTFAASMFELFEGTVSLTQKK